MKKTLCVILVLAAVFAFAACGKTETAPVTDDVTVPVTEPAADTETAPLPEEDITVKVGVLTGPTGVGAVNMWNNAENADSGIKYAFSAAAAPDELVAGISKGDVDVAAVATNLAAKLYKKTNGGIKVLAVNTYGVLSVLTNGETSVTSLADLKGKKIVTTGQGANPEYIINYLLTKNGVDPTADVTVEFKAEGADLVPVWATEPDAVIIAPAPVSTTILSKYDGAVKALDLTDEWKKVAPDSALMMGCVIARTDFIDAHPAVIADFMEKYASSIEAAGADPAATGALCEKYGIVPKASIAEKAMPDFHLCWVTGEEMKNELSGYLQVLFDADSSSVGSLPDNGFWYEK